MSAINSACCSAAWDYSSLLASALETGALEKSESGTAHPCGDSSCPIRDWLDLSATGAEATTSASSSLQSLTSTPEYEDAAEDTEVTENQAYSPISSLSTLQENSEEESVAPLARMMSTLSTAELGSVELVTEKRNDVASKLRELLAGTAFNPGGAKFTITYNYQDNSVTVGGNISTTAKNALQTAINSDTAGVGTLMQDLRDSLGLDTPDGITQRNFTLAMTSLADIEASSDVSYNVKVKITPNITSIPNGNQIPTVTYTAQVGGILQTFNAANYPTLARNTDANTAAAVTNSTISLLSDDSGLKHEWTLTKFLLTSDGKIRGTMTVTGSSSYLFDSIEHTTPTPPPSDPGDDEENTELEDPGVGNVTIDSFIQSIMTKANASQGDVLQWLLDEMPWYDPAATGSVLANANLLFKTSFKDWYEGGANSDVTDFLQNNGLQNVVKPLV